MKKQLYLICMIAFAVVLGSYNTGYAQCPQTSWAAPYLQTASGQTVLPGTTLQPNTNYYIVLEATSPIAQSLSVIFIRTADGFTLSDGMLPPFGKDVPRSDIPGKPYAVRIPIKTVGINDLPPRLYFSYRGECSTTNPRSPSPIQQAFLP